MSTLAHEDPEKYYDIGELCGAGTYGKVYKAKRKLDGVSVAFKVITTDLTDEEDLIKEILALKQCSHQNIVMFHEAFSRKKDMVITMELCAGGSLGDIRKEFDTPFSDTFLFYVVREMLKALDYMRTIKVVHRDIKGGNIFLNEDGDVKLGDFGVAAVCTYTERRNSFIGTPYWMAPEVIICEEDNTANTYDYACDVWSMGITTIELIDGNPPLHEIHPIRALTKILTNPTPKVLHPLYKDDKSVQRFVKMCLESDPKRRAIPSVLLKEEVITELPDTEVLKRETRLVVSLMKRKLKGEHIANDAIRNLLARDEDNDEDIVIMLLDELKAPDQDKEDIEDEEDEDEDEYETGPLRKTPKPARKVPSVGNGGVVVNSAQDVLFEPNWNNSLAKKHSSPSRASRTSSGLGGVKDIGYQMRKVMTLKGIADWATDPRSHAPTEDDIRSFLVAATHNHNEKQLVYAINLSRADQAKTSELSQATGLYERIIETNREAKQAYEDFELEAMDAAVAKADRLFHSSPLIEKLRTYIHSSCQKFLQAKLKHAQENCKHDLVALATVEIKNFFRSTNTSMFQLKEYGFLKHPKDFESGKNKFSLEKFNRNVFDQCGMLTYQKTGIKTSMLKLEPKLIKMATHVFHHILVYMGDIPATESDRESALQGLLELAASARGIRDEIYCQLMKQLTKNSNPISAERGWTMMEVAVRSFPPSHDFSNFVEQFLQRHAIDLPLFSKEDFINAYYTTLLIPNRASEKIARRIIETPYTRVMEYTCKTIEYIDRVKSNSTYVPMHPQLPTPWEIDPK